MKEISTQSQEDAKKIFDQIDIYKDGATSLSEMIKWFDGECNECSGAF